MPDYVPAPSYPDYAKFLSGLIGNLPTDYRNAQQQQTQIDVANTFKGGVPHNPDGTINYAAALQMQAKAGDPGIVEALGPAAQQQVFQQQAPGTLSTMLSGGAGGPATPPPVALAQLSSAPASAPAAAPAQPSGGPTLTALVSAAAPDPAQSAKATAFLAKVLGVDPTAPLTPDQVARAQRIMAAAKLGPSAPGQLSAPVRWDLMGSGQGSQASAGAKAPQATDYPDTQAGHAAFIKARAEALGLDPNLALGIAGAEGLRALSPNNPNSASAIDRNSDGTPFSFGDFQLNVRNGLGNAARAKGIDPANPKQWQAADEFALEQMKSGGLGPWKGDTAVEAYQAQGGGRQGNRPIVPQFPLPRGVSPGQEQQAILQIDQEIAKAATNPNPYAQGQIQSLIDIRNRIAASVAPQTVTPGERIVDPRTSQTLYQSPPNNLNELQAQRFLQEHPNATAEEIQQFNLASRAPKSGIGMYLAKYAQEHPDATDEDIKRVAQDYQSEGTALTRFASGPQGNVIRSFNVLVDHLGTLEGAIGALKNGDIHLFNSAAQEWSRQTGNPAPTNFDATKALVGDEIIKAVVGGAGALGDREEAKAVLDKANSPAQLAGAIDQYRKLALGQLRGFGHQYQTATGRDDFDRLLAPGTKRFFGAEGTPTTQTAPSGSGAGQPAKVTTEDEYNALPKGTTYIHPDGTTRTKQ